MGLKPRPTPPISNRAARFGPEVFGFLIEVAINNNREWFGENKAFYESAVKQPFLAFIEVFADKLAKISPHFQADSRSMLRIYRDVRFSKDKRPYKTNAAAHFRHKVGKDIHAPGFYLHIEPGSVFVGSGMWHPEPQALLKIRKRIASKPDEWRKVLSSPQFSRHCKLHGDSLQRPPRDFDPEHPLISDIKRKDFIAMVELSDSDVLSADFPDRVARACEKTAPLSAFLCKAVGVPF